MSRKKAIQKELDIYLSKRRKPAALSNDKNVLESLFTFLRSFSRKKPEEEYINPEEIMPEEKPEEITEEIEALEEIPDEPEKRNFLKDLFNFLTPTRKVKEEEILDVSDEAISEKIESEAHEDMKLLARTVLGMIEHISPDEVKHLKKTQEFNTFKELLKKYKVIK